MDGEYRFFRGKGPFPGVPMGLIAPQPIENKAVKVGSYA
jgi:hypothetical protein